MKSSLQEKPTGFQRFKMMDAWLWSFSLVAALTLAASLGLEVSAKGLGNGTRRRDKQTSENITKSPPLLESESPILIVGVARENIDLYCPIKCFPRCRYEWTKNNQPITKSERFRFSGKRKSHLQIRSMKHEDSGKYGCKGINGFGKESAQIHLVVRGDDPFRQNLLKQSSSKRSSWDGSVPQILVNKLPTEELIELDRGTSLPLTCEASGNLPPNVTWYKNQQFLLSSSSNSSTLLLSNVTDKDSGVYRCEAENDFGKSSYELQVQVKVEPWQDRGVEILGLTPSNLTLVAGTSGVITCVVRSEAELPHLFWVKKLRDGMNFSADGGGRAQTPFRFFDHNGEKFEALNKTEIEERSKNIYQTRLVLTNVTLTDAGSYHCLMFSRFKGISHSQALVFVKPDEALAETIKLNRQRAATVQWILLWSFAFVIVIILIVVCFTRLYGWHWSLKKFGFLSTQMKQPVKSSVNNRVETPAKSPGETMSTLVDHSHHNDRPFCSPQRSWDLESSFTNFQNAPHPFHHHRTEVYKSRRRNYPPSYPSCLTYCPVPVYQEPHCTPANSII